ncbi:MAG TPA: NAD(P)H:quinone oxidoreductase [Symbiobacteriaceae bacterium]|jgi:NAD(P)H dehydrogenase (quinone)|nr:NAD(P)H:quinone oxidoreductase [Symbiobacteriaceae bacterium]
MAGVKVAVIYYSSTGNTHKMAQAVAAGAQEAGAEVRVRQVAELAPEAAINSNPGWKAHHEATKNEPRAALDDLEWADAIILGTPTRFGNAAAQLRQFLDTTGGLWFQGKLANKVCAGFVCTSNPHGGHESTLLALYNTFYHWGAIIAPPGYTDPALFASGGNPYGASATGTDKGMSDAELSSGRILGKRAATVAGWVVKGKG